MTKNYHDPWLRKTKIKYALMTFLVYLACFLVLYIIFDVVLIVLQAHPYIYLFFSILILIIDIFITNYIINVYFQDRWIQKPTVTDPTVSHIVIDSKEGSEYNSDIN